MSSGPGDATGDPPEVQRRRVRSILRDERENAGITQQDAAGRVLWSLSKLIRVENGSNPPSPADVRVLMMEYGAPEARVAEAVEIARSARQPSSWDAYKLVYSMPARSLFANEPAARVIHKHESSLIPGLLQTEEYARALLANLGVDDDSIEQRVQVRLQRQEILDTPSSPTLDFVLGEATVSRPIGGTPVMRAQIERLKEMAQNPRILLRLLPFSAGAYPGMGVAFTILEFRDPELPDLLYLESGDTETIVRDDKDEVDLYLRRFSRLQEIASPPHDLPAQLDKIVRDRFGE